MIKLLNIAFVSECKLNFISLNQLQKTDITYYDELTWMTLMKRENIIAYTRQDQNFFMLDFIQLEKAMTTGQGRLTHIVSKNK